MQTAVLDEVTLEYEVRGAGDPVVLIHLAPYADSLRADFPAYSPRPAVAARSGPDTTGQNTKRLPTAFALVEP